MEKGKISLLFLTRYGRKGASSRYRSLQYIPGLQEQGFSVTVSPLLDDTYLTNRYRLNRANPADIARGVFRRARVALSARRYDGVVIEKECLPYFPSILERWLTYLRIPYVVDYDDAIFHHYDQSDSALVRLTLGRKISSIMRASKLVIAGNEYLADYARAAGAPAVGIVPTVVDLERYLPAARPAHPLFTIGWIGSPSTSSYLAGIAPALAEVCRDGRAKVLLIGAGSIALPGVPVQRIEWSEASEVNAMLGFDVGIMPLEDEPWARGKCGFKLIQYMASALPVVASPVGVNTRIVEVGKTGFLANSHEEWTSALRTLQADAELRDRMGRAGREVVEREYSLQVTGPRYVELLKGAIERPRAKLAS
jgi:glycosyltransferase involved in cell wall biosynthesis